MSLNLQKYCPAVFMLLFLSVAIQASAQIKRVSTVNPMSGGNSSYDDIYDYDNVDIKPQFPGGECDLFNFINETREYPYEAYKKKIEGRVLCTFVVNSDGSISNIDIVRGASNEQLNREAMRVISVMPKWEAGKVNGKVVRVRCFLPIAFRL